MKRIAYVVAAVGLAIGLLTPAMAADIPSPVSNKSTAVYVPNDDVIARWTGFYVGAGTGADWLGSSVYTDQGHAWPGGRIFAGYDRQFGKSFVAGPYGDFSYSGARAGVTPDLASVGATGLARNEWGGDLGVRAGWLATSKVLFYGEGGVSLAPLRMSYGEPKVGPAWSANRAAFGWYAGGGAEAFIASKVTLRAEYRNSELNAGLGAPVRSMRDQTALFGIAWRP
jgi:outer membrane immunogenic protein